MTRRRVRYSDKDNGGIILRIVCAVVFCVSSFLYLFVYQQDVIALRLSRLFGSDAYYIPLVFSVLGVLSCHALQLFCLHVFRHEKPLCAITYFPSLALLWCIAEFHVSGAGSWAVLLVLVLMPFFLMFMLGRHWFFLWHVRHVRTLSRRMWINVMALSAGFILISCCSSYDDVVRFRLKAERMIASGDYDKSLEVGSDAAGTDASLTMLRIYALSRTDKLGERLFRYPLAGGSRALLPDGRDVGCLLLDDALIYKYVGAGTTGYDGFPALRHLFWKEEGVNGPLRDYVLCGCLLDKNLDGFVKSLLKCGIEDFSSLPRHYREALVLYCRTRSGHILTYKNAAMDADYADMQALRKKYMLSPKEQCSAVKDAYGRTYWYYYYYADRR